MKTILWIKNGCLVGLLALFHSTPAGAQLIWNTDPVAGHTGPVTSVAYSPDGTRVVSGSDDQTARVWEVDTGAQVARFTGHANDVRAVTFSPDGLHVVSGSDDNTARLWEVATGAEVVRFTGHRSDVLAVAYSPDGMHVVSGADFGSVALWEASTGAVVGWFTGAGHTVRSLAFSPDGTHVVSGSGSNRVHVWEVATGAEVARFRGHRDDVNSVAFSPDGTHVVSASDDETVRVWEVATGMEVAKIQQFSEPIISIALSPDGTRLALVSVAQFDWGEPVATRLWMWNATNILPVGIDPIPDAGLTQVMLDAYPNPAYGSIHIRYVLPKPTKVRLRVHDLLGRESTLLVDQVKTMGPHSVRFDTSHLPSGMYYLSFQSEYTQVSRLMAIVR